MKFEKKHGQYGTKLYWVWDSMKNRVLNPRHKYFSDYGGRGITICKEWVEDFSVFYRWAIEAGYREGLTLDRRDNDGNYSPENCRWITHKEQQNNKRNNHWLEVGGEKHTIAEWSEISGIKHGTIMNRIKRGWSSDKILSEVGPYQKRKAIC